MPVITISSEFGAGGPTVGKQLAERLGYDYVDQDLIARIALDLGVPEEKVAEFDEAKHSGLRSFFTTVFDFQALKKGAAPGPQPEAPTAYDDRDEIPYQFQVKGWIDRDVYRQMMVRVISALGQRGGAVIKGRGSQWILRDHPAALHLRFVADPEDRIARTMERRSLDRAAAAKLIASMDQRGEGYVRAYFDRDLKDPTLYHLVLNSSRIPLDRCLGLVEGLTRDLFPGDTP